ncbi:MAG: aldehyde dehydrogenase family protein, partial [Verrucomicrobiota bacterium]
LFPSSLEASSEAIQTGFVQSLTLGMGQFCTNPALVLGVAGPQWDQFVAGAAEKVSETTPGAMLHAGIGEAYAAGVELLRRVDGVNVVGEASASIHEAGAVLAETSLEVFEREFALLSQEIFGPASILVTCPSVEDFQRVAASLEVSLSATLHVDEGEVEEAQSLLRSLEGKTGRLIVNGFPTGLEVCGALHHGGGFPASSHGFFTSVGTNAIYRFVRPICYQGVPDALLPPELQDANPLGVPRKEG